MSVSEKVLDVLTRIQNSALWTKAEAEANEEVERGRAALVQERRKLLADRESRRPAQDKAVAEAAVAVEAAEEKLRKAQEKYRAAYLTLRNDDHVTDHAAKLIALKLKASPPACLAAFLDEIESELESLRTTPRTRADHAGFFRKTLMPAYRHFSAKPSAEARRQALCADRDWARESAPAEVATEAEALAVIEKRRAAWPAVEFIEVA